MLTLLTKGDARHWYMQHIEGKDRAFVNHAGVC